MPAFDLSPYYVIFFVVFLVICFFIYMNIILAVIYNNYRKHLKVCVACFLIITHCCFCTKYPFIYLFFLIFIYFPSQCHSLVYFMKKVPSHFCSCLNKIFKLLNHYLEGFTMYYMDITTCGSIFHHHYMTLPFNNSVS